jgi:hypothetical protein
MKGQCNNQMNQQNLNLQQQLQTLTQHYKERNFQV